MKTENEFSDYFLQVYQKNAPVSDSNPEDVHSLAKSYWTDMTAHLSFYFSNEDRLKMSEIAAEKLALHQKTVPDLLQAWKLVLTDFNQHNFWNFEKLSRKPKIKQTEEQKIFWSLFQYTWAFIQSMIILKVAVYYFGLESASHPDQVSSVWVWLFFSLSVSSLIFFAYRHHRNSDKN